MSTNNREHQADHGRPATATPGPPDFTDAIMAKLGYQRVDVRTARRRRITAFARRCTVAAALFAALLAGYQIHQEHGDVREVSSASVPEAISRDLLHYQQGLNDVKTMLLDLTTAADRLGAVSFHPQLLVDDELEDADLIRGSGGLEVMDRPGEHVGENRDSSSGGDGDVDESGGERGDPDIESAPDASGPYRWV